MKFGGSNNKKGLQLVIGAHLLSLTIILVLVPNAAEALFKKHRRQRSRGRQPTPFILEQPTPEQWAQETVDWLEKENTKRFNGFVEHYYPNDPEVQPPTLNTILPPRIKAERDERYARARAKTMRFIHDAKDHQPPINYDKWIYRMLVEYKGDVKDVFKNMKPPITSLTSWS